MPRRVISMHWGTPVFEESQANWVLILLPTVLATSAISSIGALFLTALLILAAFWFTASPQPRLKLTLAAAILPVLGSAIVLRANYPSTAVSVLLFGMGCVATALSVHLSATKAGAFVSLVDGIGLFLIVSMALWLVGFDGSGGRTEGLENSLTGGVRAVFPLTNSLAATPAVAAVYVVAAIPIIRASRRLRFLRLAVVGLAAAIFVLSDSRVSILCVVVVAGSVLLLPRLFRATAPWLIVFPLALPFAYSAAQGLITGTLTALGAYAPWLVRSGEQASTLSHRDHIWFQALDYLLNRTDWLHQLFGFGQFGQVASGASAYWAFRGFGRDELLVTPHNSFLQILFDGGWLIGLLFAGLLVYLARVLSSPGSPMGFAGLGLLMGLSVVSATEVALSPSQAQPTWWILLALSSIVFSVEGPFDEIVGPQLVPALAHRPTLRSAKMN